MIGHTRWRFPKIDSTQRVAFHLAEAGAVHGTVVRADYQTHGRGRQGRRWESSPGSALMFSVVLRPHRPMHQLGSVSILMAATLADVIADLIDDSVQIKWPSDVMVGGRKISGILMQTRSSAAVLGIGINIDSPANSLPDTATCLERHTGQKISADALLELTLTHLNTTWNEWQPQLDSNRLLKLDSRLWRIGEEVSLIGADREIHGRILGIGSTGGLRLSQDNGERVFMAGEIVRGPRSFPSDDLA